MSWPNWKDGDTVIDREQLDSDLSQKELRKLREKLSDAHARNAMLERKVKELEHDRKKDIDYVKQEFDQWRATLQNKLEKTISELSEKLTVREQEISRLEEELSSAQAAEQSASNECSKVQAEVSQLVPEVPSRISHVASRRSSWNGTNS